MFNNYNKFSTCDRGITGAFSGVVTYYVRAKGALLGVVVGTGVESEGLGSELYFAITFSTFFSAWSTTSFRDFSNTFSSFFLDLAGVALSGSLVIAYF